MEIKLTRTWKKPEFDRTPLDQVYDLPREELDSIVDQIETMTEFKSFIRRGKCHSTIWFIVLILAFVIAGANKKYRERSWNQAVKIYSKGYGTDEYFTPSDPESEKNQLKAKIISTAVTQALPEPNSAHSSNPIIAHLLKNMNSEQYFSFLFMMERNKKDLPKEIFSPADDQTPSKPNDFGGIFEKEFESLKSIMHRNKNEGYQRRYRKLQAPSPAPEDINNLTGLPHKYDNEVHKLLVKQRDTHYQKFNLMFKKERFATFVSTLAFSHHHLRLGGFLVFWFLLPCFLGCCKVNSMKKISKKIQKVIEVQNTAFRRKGYYWTLNNKLTQLTLNRNANFYNPVRFQNVGFGLGATAPPQANETNDSYNMVI